MAQPQIIEGTREELERQLRLFPKDRRFQLILLPQPGAEPPAEEASLAERFAGRVGRFSFEPEDLSERTEEYYRELLATKYAQEQKE